MAKSKYLTAPIPSKKTPAGIPYILTNEAAERFAFYGMTGILVMFMTTHLMGRDGTLKVMGDEEAKTWFHLFKSAVYFLPLLGALLSDIWLAKYKTVLYFSLVYCVGFFALTSDDTRLGLGVGLVLMAIGSGVIKPCVSANVGDQFGKTNQHLMSGIFGWFYFAINLGAAISMWYCPWLRVKYGPQVAFGVPALFMLLATIAYWMGRKKFVHVPAGGVGFVKECLSGEGLKALGKLCIIFLFVAMFWALFDQSQSSWVLQATKMDLKVFGFKLLPEQPQAFNPVLVMIMIPLFSYGIYPALNKVIKLTPLRKIAIGFFVAVVAFAVTAWVEMQINGGDIVKYSSMRSGLLPINVLDGRTDTAGWSSNSAPIENEPEELVIRLRERRKWTVSSIEIEPSTTLSKGEIVGILTKLSGEAWKDLTSARRTDEPGSEKLEELKKKYKLLKAAAHRAKKAKDVAAARTIAIKAMEESRLSTRMLEDKLYYPKEVSLFAADFTGKLLPKLIFELEDEEKQDVVDPVEFARKNGWTHVGDFLLAEDGAAKRFEFDPLSATHILVQVKSNYGADRVKISEIRVLTTETMPEKSRATAAQVWPNVAAIGFKPHISWQMLMYVILTAAEIVISITCLEFAYTQAPKKMKSFIMAVFLLSISLGNAFTAVVNAIIVNEDGSSKLPGASYYWFFTIAMLVTAVLFIPVAKGYRAKSYIQEEGSGQSGNQENRKSGEQVT